VKACALLSQAQVSKLGVAAPGKHQNVGTVASGCRWHTHEAMVTVDVRTNADLSQVNANGGTKKPITVAGREAVLEHDPYGCMVALGVGSQGRVDVTAYKRVSSGQLNGDCGTAKRAAELIAPELPKS
jgi:hypothetical protein